MKRKSLFIALAICAFATHETRAQGGPPMITDDPGTPGNGHWENNLAIAFEHRGSEWSIDAPAIDLNYGWGDHIQLTLQTSLALLKRSDCEFIGGLGATEAAVKWRFLDEERSGFDMSMFPRVIFNVLQSSVRRGLSEDGTRFSPSSSRKNSARSIWISNSERSPARSVAANSSTAWLAERR